MPRLNFTFTTGLVLQAISAGHGYGFQIMDATGLPGGTVYPALRRLEGAGLLTSMWEDAELAVEEGRPARRYYALTPAGEQFLCEARERFQGLHLAIKDSLSPGLGEVTP